MELAVFLVANSNLALFLPCIKLAATNCGRARQMSHTRTHVQRDCVLRHVPPRATCHIGFGCIYVYLYEIFKVTTRRANSSHCDIYKPSQAGSQREEERCRVQVMTLLAAAVAAAVATEEPRVCFINMHDPSSAQLGVHTRIHRSLSLSLPMHICTSIAS